MNTNERIRAWELQLKKHERRLEQADTESSEYGAKLLTSRLHLRRLNQHYQR